jgi:hypothetical protein
MRHGRSKEREKRRRTGDTIVKKKERKRVIQPTNSKGDPRLQPMARCSKGRPGRTGEKRGGNLMEKAGQPYDASKSCGV